MNRSCRISTLTAMINLRRLPGVQAGAEISAGYANSRIDAGGRAEESILELTELAYLLQADGFPTKEVFRRIGTVHAPAPQITRLDLHGCPLRSYLVHYLRANSPLYLSLGSTLLNAALTIAELWSELSAERSRSESWPPQGMLDPPAPLMADALSCNGEDHDVPAHDRVIESLDKLLTRDRGILGREFRRMRSRVVPGDTLRNYSTGGRSFELSMGSSGLALVRNGRAIDYVELMRN